MGSSQAGLDDLAHATWAAVLPRLANAPTRPTRGRKRSCVPDRFSREVQALFRSLSRCTAIIARNSPKLIHSGRKKSISKEDVAAKERNTNKLGSAGQSHNIERLLPALNTDSQLLSSQHTVNESIVRIELRRVDQKGLKASQYEPKYGLHQVGESPLLPRPLSKYFGLTDVRLHLEYFCPVPQYVTSRCHITVGVLQQSKAKHLVAITLLSARRL